MCDKGILWLTGLKSPGFISSTSPISSTKPAIGENHLECALFCRVSKRVIRLHDVVHREAMSHELARLQLARAHDLQQHRCCYRVHQPGGDRNVTVPEFLQVEFHQLAVDAHVCDASAGRDN